MSYYDEMQELAEREGPFDDPAEDELRNSCAAEYRTCRWCAYLGECGLPHEDVDAKRECRDWDPSAEAEDAIDEDVREAAAEEREQEHLRNWWRWM